jgi:UDP-N-acetylglucosamine 2-epimerase (non-hydrolysing)
LLREGIPPGAIHVTGNTVIDSLLRVAQAHRPFGLDLDPRERMVLVTAHRRDSIGEPLKKICRAVRTLHTIIPDLTFVWPIHPNPAVRSIVEGMMDYFPRVRLIEPLAYAPFVAAMERSTLILTDSGGIQEEAPALGKPVLVLRNESERPEAVEAGVARLVGQDPRKIVAEACRLLNDPVAYRSMARRVSPYGDGKAASRTVRAIAEFFEIESRFKAVG